MMKAVLFALAMTLAAFPAAAQSPGQATATPSRELFLILFSPGPSWRPGVPMRQQDLREHAAYHDRLVREGRGFAGGGYVGMDGGMAIVRAVDLAEAQAILAADPAIVNGVFAGELRQWRPRFHTERPLVEAAR
ncbi:YciI family protein [Sphingosinicella sp. LHD-64]|uniref:YciI family protein n=1 Tax=Sphingosinicella sp. LHD-64 TaxID=3072139 RepID=UPI00280F8B04|nr:YciI family protein [Sphingosinicella sp. LHD-64]MDQ8756778.1 YciI family protein [Sphingosinicella sp. LHD-64]